MKLNIKDTKFFLAGGCVRDKLLKRPFKDRDYVVLTPLAFTELVAALEQEGAEVSQAKEEFLTIRAKKDGEVFDIAYPRVEGAYSDGRRPDSVSQTDSLRQDSSRRDFTINAMYKDENGNILDFHGGQQDLKDELIRTVGDPYERFGEDALRILRALRFAAQLGFSIEEATAEAMARCMPLLKKESISADRIREESNKILLYQPNIFGWWRGQLPNLLQDKGLRLEVTAKK